MADLSQQFSLSWTVWKVWTHPGLALDLLEDAFLRQESFDKELEEIRNLLESKESTIEELHRKLSEWEDNNSALKCEYEKNQSLTIQLENALNENIRLRQEINNVSIRLGEYETQIFNLRKEVKEQQDIEADLMAFDRKLSGYEEVKKNYEERIKALESKLMSRIPDNKLVVEDVSRDVFRESESSQGIKDKLKTRKDEQDWLMDLPEDLL